MMARLVAAAENFAFGPAGKLMTVLEPLAERGHNITFVGTGTAFEIASRSPAVEAVRLDTDAPDFADLAADLFGAADLVVSCMDRPSVRLARKKGRPVVWLDTLFWWWDEIPDDLLDVDLYLSQRSLVSPRNTARYAHRIPGLREVGPIVDLRHRGHGAGHLLVAFGGGEATGWYRIGVDTRYPYVMSRALIAGLDTSGFSQVLVTGNASVMEELSTADHRRGFSFACLGHNEFLRQLGRSDALLTVPSLETPLEGWAYGVPTVFLPPSNSSQYVQLDEFRASGVAAASVHLRDVLPALEMRDRPLQEIMAEFLAQLQEFERAPRLVSAAVERVSTRLQDRPGWPALVAAGDRYLASLGGAGTVPAVREIERLLRSKEPG
jgi:hypothetical protein